MAGVPGCDPWPLGAPATCNPGEAHFPGEAGCGPLGNPCPSSTWPDGLPTDRPVLYVLNGAPPGGAGTAVDPFDTIARATAAASSGTIIALSRGTFDEAVSLPAGVTLWGACVAETTVASTIANTTWGTVSVVGSGAEVRNLRLSGNRPGVAVLSASGSVHLEDVAIEGARTFGIVVNGSGSLTAHSLVVRDTQESGLSFGRGLAAAGGGQIDIERAVFERNHQAGISVEQGGTVIRLRDVAVVATQPRSTDRLWGEGISLTTGGAVDASGLALEANSAFGMDANGTGTRLVANDVVVRGTQLEVATGLHGMGVQVQNGAEVQLTHAWVLGNHGAPVGARGTDTRLTIEDAVLGDTIEGTTPGTGLIVEGGNASVRRAVLWRNPMVALLFAGAASIVLEDVSVGETYSTAYDGTGGQGLIAAQGTSVTGTRILVEGSRYLGLAAVDPGTTIQLSDLSVLGTRQAACADTGCGELSGGNGVSSFAGAWVELTRFRLSQSAVCGAQIALGGTMDLHDGEISHNPIGLNVQTADFDLRRLADRVVYLDNDQNLDMTALPYSQPVGL